MVRPMIFNGIDILLGHAQAAGTTCGLPQDESRSI